MKLLQIRQHARRAPIDPYASKRDEKTALLREFVAFRELEREIGRVVDIEVARERALDEMQESW